jgi:hypothetical protein
MPATYEKIATTTLGTAAANITFSSISSAYTDLRLVLVARSSRIDNTDPIYVRFNNDTGTNYSYTFIFGDGSSVTSARNTSSDFMQIGEMPAANATANVFNFCSMDIFSYAGSTNKTSLSTQSRDVNGTGRVDARVHLWRSTSAINEVKLTSGSASNFVAGTTATLYGILKA